MMLLISPWALFLIGQGWVLALMVVVRGADLSVRALGKRSTRVLKFDGNMVQNPTHALKPWLCASSPLGRRLIFRICAMCALLYIALSVTTIV